ncbi:MAG: hypothetical protein HC806_07820 [Anaerolineae bacterium]|nr:hypothetical protein [Anaerolineae bacterium]
MKNSISIGTIFGLKHTAQPSAIIATGFLWFFLAATGIWLLDLTILETVLGGLVAALLHWVGESWHHFGHALAARSTGYPMHGVEYWWLLGRSIYPPDEPELPAWVHIRRALGGAPASLVMTGIVGMILLVLRESGSLVYWIMVFVFFENLLVFTLGAFLPLGFTDGSTLLRYWGKR